MANVVGISGFENSIPFKKAHWPGLEEREYRISQGHDSAAVLLVDGKIIAGAAEERFSRKKHTGDFPIGAIHYCLETAGIKPNQIDAISHGFDYSPYRAAFSLDPTTAEQYREVFSKEKLLQQVGQHLPGFPTDRVHQVNHHIAHAASAYYTSGWDECLVIIIDGMGENQSATVYHARNNNLEKLAEVSAKNSIGILYSIITLHLGFDFNSDEYKIMGLAPYGDPARYRHFFEQAVILNDDGTIKIPILQLNNDRIDRETYGATRRYLEEHLIPHRVPDSDTSDDHRDVAASLQECLDKVMLHICGHFGRKTGLRKLAMAGGVALNCTANGRLLQSGIFDEIYVQPAAGDDGTALGAALWTASRNGGVKNYRFPVPFFGPEYSQAEIDKAIADTGNRVEVVRYDFLTYMRDQEFPNPVVPKRHYIDLGHHLPRNLHESDIEKLFQTMGDHLRDRTIFTLMLHTGLRVGELVHLGLGDVFFSEPRSPHLRLKGKGDRERMVYLSASAAQLLADYLASRPAGSGEHLFLNRRGRPITITGIQLQLAKYCRVAGIWMTCHQLRHTFACRMIAAGVPVTSLQKILGHGSLRTTQLYIEVSDRQVEQDYQAGIRKLTAMVASTPAVRHD